MSGSDSPTTDDEWYSFTMVSAGMAGNYALIDYTASLGNLDLSLYDSSGNLITQASTAQNFEQISLQGLAAPQVYYLEVSGYNGATNPDYTLTLDTPEAVPTAGQGNDTPSTALDLGEIQGEQTIDNPNDPLSITTGEQIWYKFTTAGPGRAGHYVSLSYNQAAGPLVIELYDDGILTNPNEPYLAQANSFGDTETISLNRCRRAPTICAVYGYNGTNIFGRPPGVRPSAEVINAADRVGFQIDLHQILPCGMPCPQSTTHSASGMPGSIQTAFTAVKRFSSSMPGRQVFQSPPG